MEVKRIRRAVNYGMYAFDFRLVAMDGCALKCVVIQPTLLMRW